METKWIPNPQASVRFVVPPLRQYVKVTPQTHKLLGVGSNPTIGTSPLPLEADDGLLIH